MVDVLKKGRREEGGRGRDLGREKGGSWSFTYIVWIEGAWRCRRRSTKTLWDEIRQMSSLR